VERAIHVEQSVRVHAGGGASPGRGSVEDLQFVVVELSKLDRGDPVLRGALDLARVGAFGFSLGGSTAANAMKNDPQIRAGADLDGAIHDPVLVSGLSRPFMIMLDQGASTYFQPFVRRLMGPYLVLQLDGSRHDAFTDGVWRRFSCGGSRQDWPGHPHPAR
jgi:pimeloyl-ACP methyl ester carboxylesterase